MCSYAEVWIALGRAVRAGGAAAVGCDDPDVDPDVEPGVESGADFDAVAGAETASDGRFDASLVATYASAKHATIAGVTAAMAKIPS